MNKELSYSVRLMRRVRIKDAHVLVNLGVVQTV